MPGPERGEGRGVRGGGGRSLKTQLKEEKKKLFTASSE